MTTLISSKGPTESVVVTLDFSRILPAGVTLQSIVGTPTVTSMLGIDFNPSAILNGTAQLNTAKTAVLQPVTLGVDGEVYRISADCIGTDGERITVSAAVPVQTQ